jgi:SAM-dependent methyltransferase
LIDGLGTGNAMDERFRALQQRYQSGELPWDRPLPPPEIIALAERLPAGRALDLGSGTGRAAIYLAQRGWTVDGVDFVPEAVAIAEARAVAAGVGAAVQFSVGSVSALRDHAGPYDLAIDVGCLHGLPADERQQYVAGLAERLRPTGLFILFARLSDATDDRWATAVALKRALAADFTLLEWTAGETVVGEDRWQSVWSLWQRRA